MATFKHISSKNADYGAAEKYFTFAHDEFSMKPTLDENGRLVPRKDFRIATLNCGDEDFPLACMRANLRYGKNQKREDVKSHHYIISFDPRDAVDNGLTIDKAQQLGEEFCENYFPGHQAIVCTHPDGHNHSGNIHIHIVINSLRIKEVPLLPYMDRPADTRDGCKHRCTDAAMEYFKSELMEMCHRENLYQIDLLHGSANRVTEREYWAKKKGQKALDEKNAEITAAGLTPRTTKFETDKDRLRQAIRVALNTANNFDEFSAILLRQGISVKESRGRLSYLTPDRAKPITARKLGDDFDRTAVFARLEQNTLANIERRKKFAAEQKAQPTPPQSILTQLHEAEKTAKAQNKQRVQRTVDVAAKAVKGKGMEQWAKNFNLKQMAAAQFLYETSGYKSLEELDAAVAIAQANMQESLATIKVIEAKIAEKKELQKQVIAYSKTRSVRDGLKKIKSDKKRAAYRAEHESDFIIADSAVRYFKAHDIEKIPSYKALQSEIERLIADKNAAYSPYLEHKNHFRELQTIRHNLAELHNEPQKSKAQKQEHDL